MNQTSNKKKKGGKTSATRQPRTKQRPKTTSNAQSLTRARPSVSVPNRLLTTACGLTDPFCQHAVGAKYMDNSSTRTLPYTFRKTGLIATNATGGFAFTFFPKLAVESIWTPAVLTGSSVVGWANSSGIGLFPTTSYRIVSAGCLIKRIAAPLYAAGSVHLRSWLADDMFTTYGVIDCLSYNCSESLDLPYQDCKEISIIPERTPQLIAAFYKTSGDVVALTNNGLTGFYPVTVLGVGLPPETNVFTYEYIVHAEVTISDGDGLAQLATPPPAYNPIVVNVAKQATATMTTFAREGVKVVSDAIANSIRTRLKTALSPTTMMTNAMLLD